MFIELTDHLRCPADHDEAFLVLLPDRLEGRSVIEGQLGCLVCGRTFRLERGELDFGGAPAPPSAPGQEAREAGDAAISAGSDADASFGADAGSGLGGGSHATASVLDATAIVTLAGMHGPGGYFVLVGAPAGEWREVVALNPGIGIVAVNPGPGVADEPGISVLRAGMIPLKANSMRGVVLGPRYGADTHWVREAARVTLPGLRIVGEGSDEPPAEVIDLMASAGGAWVGTKARRREGS
jgi:hypothetical protein